MSKFVTFQAVSDKDEPVRVTVNPLYIETVVDLKAFQNKDCTQITMNSGSKFFVKQTYDEVVNLINS